MSSQLKISEEDVVRLTLEFLHNRDLHITQLSLERETGVINGNFADDILFLRQLILDGQWDDVLEFVQPLSALVSFDMKRFKFVILRQKYIELLCIKSEIKAYNNVKDIVDEIVSVLNELEHVVPSKEEYSSLCLLLNLPSLSDHSQYKNWNPSNARVQCFQEVYPLVDQFLSNEKKNLSASLKSSKNDRLMQLIIKGILYEVCVNFCQAKATGSNKSDTYEVNVLKLLDGTGFVESDLSLLSWLQSIPGETFNVPFEQKMLDIDIDKLERPSLHTSWTEHMLVTPIKPRTFPHLAMPFRRPRSAADAMTRSLRPLPEGAAMHTAEVTKSTLDCGSSTSCFAGFHLTGIKDSTPMNTSVERLFENKGSESVFSMLNLSLKPIVEHNQHEVQSTATYTPAEESNHSNKLITKDLKPTQTKRHTNEHLMDNLSPQQTSNKSITSNSENDVRRELMEFQIKKKLECDDYIRNLRSQDEQQHTTEPTKDENMAETVGGAGINYDNNRSIQDVAGNQKASPALDTNKNSPPAFKPITMLEDLQAIRCGEFHPNGKVYAVGSNTKTLRLCATPTVENINNAVPSAPVVMLKRTKHHRGSIYCLAWSPAGDLLASGSNDKTVKLMYFNSDTCNFDRPEVELSMHDGTVRDVCFIEDSINKASLLLSAGAGDCKIYVTDCASGKTFQALSGHTGQVFSLYNWDRTMFVSGAHDKTVRFWDLRTGGCVNVITPGSFHKASAVSSLAVDPSGRLLVCGQEDGACVLHDFRGSRALQRFQPHTADVRSVRFSPGAFYLLTSGYDGSVMLTDIQGDLTRPLPSVLVARHQDKVISARWHPDDFSFLSTSADKTAVFWVVPPV